MEDLKLDKKERKEIVYPTKPKRDEKAEQNDLKSTVICNLRKIDLENGKRKIRQYAIHFEPEIAEDNLPLKKQVLRQLRKDLRAKFNKFFQGGDTLFVCEASDLQEKIVLETTIENTLYKAQFVLTQNIINCRNINKRCRDHIKIKNLMETLVKTIIFANNHIVKFDKSSFFDYFDFETFGRDGKSKIWHGYSTAVCITEMGLCLRINDKNKMITGKTAYDKIVELSKKYQNCILCQDCLNDVNDYFSGKTVVAQYGSYRAYRIGEVLRDKTVKNTTINYVDGDGKTTTITLKNYYQNQYNIKLIVFI